MPRRRSGRAPSRASSFHFATPESIVRPSPSHNEPVYERIEGITRSYQYYMIKEGDVLVRRHSCWCLACMQAAMSGHSGLSSEYVTQGCARSRYLTC